MNSFPLTVGCCRCGVGILEDDSEFAVSADDSRLCGSNADNGKVHTFGKC